jgi:hypothetical protein
MPDNAKKVWDLLGFQYKPLETKFLKFCKENKQTEIIRKYNNADYSMRIRILDRYAQFLGL